MMYKGLRHTIACSKCGDTTKSFVTYAEMELFSRNNKSICCNVDFEYVGLQIYRENIINEPIQIASKQPPQEEVAIDLVESPIQQEVEEIVETSDIKKVVEELETKEVIEEIIENSEVKMEQRLEKVVMEIVPKTLTITDLIDTTGKVHNGVMIPALRAALEENSKEKVDLLKSHYPNVFDSTLKYIPKKLIKRLEAIK